MWTCPKCGRSFKNTNQSHTCGSAPATVDAYIADQPEAVRVCLQAVRRTLRAALPEAEERIAWGMPTYWRKKNIIHFAAGKKHLGLYPGDEAVRCFADELAIYKTSKGAIQLPYTQPMPLELIACIARWCAEKVAENA